MKICSVDGCNGEVIARGYCTPHYYRDLRHGSPFAGATNKGAAQQWITDHIDHQENCCLIWPFAKDKSGYGRFGSGLAHRAMCSASHGSPPSARSDAAHSCNNGHLGCVNPKHLRWATRAENEADKILNKTDNRGSRHGMSKLNEAQVIEIRSLYSSTNMLQKEIAETYSITRMTVSDIVRRRSWAWLP